MTEAQKVFCDEYLVDFNATRAYKAAYKRCKSDLTARVNSSKLLTKTNIKDYINNRTKDRQQRTQVTQDMIVEELAKIAFGDMRELYTENGKLKNIKELDDKTASMLSSVETQESNGGVFTKKVKTSDRTKALELLGKHVGMFSDKVKVEQEKPFEVNINVRKK